MNSGVLSNLTDPAILFFAVGIVVGLVRSNLEIPPAIAKFLSLYLLMAIGFKGGQELADVGLSSDAVKALVAALVLAAVIPAWSFPILRKRINAFDAAAIAATYGSVSAVTFIAASRFLADEGEAPGGYMTVALVIMESPAIVMAVLLASWVRAREQTAPTGPSPVDLLNTRGSAPLSMKKVMHEAFTDGAQMLLIGSFIVGAVSGGEGGEAMQPFVGGIFKGLLAFFLLEMGLLVARQLREMRDVGPFLVGFALVMPVFNASVALGGGRLLGLDVGDLALLAVLAASASYIVVPAVVRYAIPEASPSRYFTMALAVTFPFNIIIGIPLYYSAAVWLAG